MSRAGRTRSRTKQPRRGRKSQEHGRDGRHDRRAQGAGERQERSKHTETLKKKVPEMTTGTVKRIIRVIEAGAARGPNGLRNNHIRAIDAAPGRLRALAAWIAAWTKGKQGHQEMKAWSAAMRLCRCSHWRSDRELSTVLTLPVTFCSTGFHVLSLLTVYFFHRRALGELHQPFRECYWSHSCSVSVEWHNQRRRAPHSNEAFFCALTTATSNSELAWE